MKQLPETKGAPVDVCVCKRTDFLLDYTVRVYFQINRTLNITKSFGLQNQEYLVVKSYGQFYLSQLSIFLLTIVSCCCPISGLDMEQTTVNGPRI